MSFLNKIRGIDSEEMEEYSSHVVLMDIKVYEEVGKAATHLIDDKTVIVNVKIQEAEIEKVVSFLEGTLFVLGGEMKQLDDGTFLCVPNTVAIVDENETEAVGERATRAVEE